MKAAPKRPAVGGGDSALGEVEQEDFEVVQIQIPGARHPGINLDSKPLLLVVVELSTGHARCSSEGGEPLVHGRQDGRSVRDGGEVLVIEVRDFERIQKEEAQMDFDVPSRLPIEGQAIHDAKSHCLCPLASFHESKVRGRVAEERSRRDEAGQDSAGVGAVRHVTERNPRAPKLSTDGQPTHCKAYLLGVNDDARAALVTSANLTVAGLAKNLELGLTHYQPGVVRQAIRWFDDLWEKAPDFKSDLIELLGSARLNLEDPWTVFLRALLEVFGDDEEEIVQPGKVDLAPFQWDGYRRALGILRRHHGVVFADGVGTGKTMIGLAFLEEYALRRGQLAVVIAPAQLRDHWRKHIQMRGLPAKVLSYQ